MANMITWSAPPENFSLNEDEIHVWAACFNDLMPYRSLAAQMLSPDEKDRANRFHFEADTQKFVTGRGLLRRLLERYTGVPAADIQLQYGSSGKPALAGGPNVQFNLSHSGEIVLFAFTRWRSVGVDIEQVRPLPDLLDIAKHYFTKTEQLALYAQMPTSQPAVFYDCWTRKEAYIKACGDGLSDTVKQIEVTLRPGDPVRLVKTAHDNPARWSLYALHPAEGYAAALAVDAHDRRLLCWQAPGDFLTS